MRKTEKYLYILAALAAPGLAMQAIEYGAGQAGLALRTFAQMAKGTYLWLILPLGILFTVNALVRMKLQERENPQIFHGVRKVLVTLLTLAILVISFFRGIFYTFTEEMVTEERMGDGYLKGTSSGFWSESRVDYYETVAVIFRRPFPGWDRQQLTQKVQERFGGRAEYVSRLPGGWHVFRLPDSVTEGEFIFFHVSEGYEMENNGRFQIMISEAACFWENRGREVMLGKGRELSLEEARDTGEETESLPPNQSLSITCYNTEEEIAFCAANLTDWLQFVRNTGQYPWGTEPLADRALAQVWVGSGEDYFLFNIEPEKILTGELSWNEGYHLLKETLTKAFCEHEEEKEAYGELRKEQEALARENQAEESWELFSSDPFQQQLGQGIDFTFLDEELGFATQMHNGGDEARLYVTENGGLSYEPVVMEGYTVSLEDGFTYNPYDYPQMPYEEGGMIFVLCGQGADGDYNGGDQAGLALYQSADGGHTFSFVEIRSRD